MKPLIPYADLIRQHVSKEFMEDDFSGTDEEAYKIFMSKDYVPLYIEKHNILFIFRPVNRRDIDYFPNTTDAEVLMMGKSLGLGVLSAIEALKNIRDSGYPWQRVWARSRNETLARIYAKMGMRPVTRVKGYAIYCWERGNG